MKTKEKCIGVVSIILLSLFTFFMLRITTKKNYQIEDFKASDVKVILKDKTISAVNRFDPEDDNMVFTWYINRVDDGSSLTNIYKADGWSESRSFEYTFDEISAGNNYLLISYVKERNSDERVNRIAAEVAVDENGHLSLTGAPLDQFSSKDINLEWNNNILTAVNHFDPYGPQFYTWYVYWNNTNHLIFKQEAWSEDNTFTFEGKPNGNYIVSSYLRDAANSRKSVFNY